MHDAVNNITIMDCYCYGGALSDQVSGGHQGGGRSVIELLQKKQLNKITLPSSQYLLD